MIVPAAPVRRSARLLQRLPDALWGPLAAAVGLALIGLAGQLAGQPLLFASLGPTLVLIAMRPADVESRFYNVLVGHLAGLGAGMAAVGLLGAQHAAPMSVAQPLPGIRVAAAVLALALTLLAQAPLRASHAPAAATTLLVALGALPPTARTAALLASAVALVAVLGEGLRRARAGPPPAGPLPRTPGEA